MNLKLDHEQIGNLLDSSANQLSRETLNGLQHARQHALQHQRSAPSYQINWNGVLAGHPHFSRRALSWGVAALVTALFLANMALMHDPAEHNRGDIDIAILTDEMPLYVYVDTDVD